MNKAQHLVWANSRWIRDSKFGSEDDEDSSEENDAALEMLKFQSGISSGEDEEAEDSAGCTMVARGNLACETNYCNHS